MRHWELQPQLWEMERRLWDERRSDEVRQRVRRAQTRRADVKREAIEARLERLTRLVSRWDLWLTLEVLVCGGLMVWWRAP